MVMRKTNKKRSFGMQKAVLKGTPGLKKLVLKRTSGTKKAVLKHRGQAKRSFVGKIGPSKKTRTVKVAPQDPTERLIRAAVENRHHYLLGYGYVEGGQLHDGKDVKWTYTGTPVMNQIFAVNVPKEAVVERLGEWNARFRNNRVSPTWLLSPLVQPANFGEYLLRDGYTHAFDFYGMVLSLKNLPREESKLPGFEVRKVTDHPGISQWSQTACHGFHIPPEMRGVFGRVMTDAGLNERFPLHHYLCYWQGRPAATVALLPEGTNVGVYWVATVPEARRHGIAKAMMIDVLRKAKDEFGVKTATLQSTEMGHTFYRGLGFADLYLEGVYEWRG